MLRNAKSLEGAELRATDGKIGHVKDLFFDDVHWVVRYLVVSAGGWLSGRRVLISPTAVVPSAGPADFLPVNLTIEQVRHSPGVETEQPVSREDELALTQYYNWPTYWTMAGVADGNLGMTVPGPVAAPDAMLPVREARVAQSVAPEHRLRSVQGLRGYEIAATDGEVGRVTDFVVDDDRWRIRFLVVDTGRLWPIKKVLLASERISSVGWDETKVVVDVPAVAIKASPPWDSAEPVSEDYARRLDGYYGRGTRGEK